MVFNATFKNISVLSWRPLLVFVCGKCSITGDFYKTKLTEIYFSEYAAIIKEKNKNLERFEASLQNQEEGKKMFLIYLLIIT